VVALIVEEATNESSVSDKLSRVGFRSDYDDRPIIAVEQRVLVKTWKALRRR
jgi:hypothetical protein